MTIWLLSPPARRLEPSVLVSALFLLSGCVCAARTVSPDVTANGPGATAESSAVHAEIGAGNESTVAPEASGEGSVAAGGDAHRQTASEASASAGAAPAASGGSRIEIGDRVLTWIIASGLVLLGLSYPVGKILWIIVSGIGRKNPKG